MRAAAGSWRNLRISEKCGVPYGHPCSRDFEGAQGKLSGFRSLAPQGLRVRQQLPVSVLSQSTLELCWETVAHVVSKGSNPKIRED